MNLILMTDSYKTSHYLQYPPNTTKVFSYIESRGGRFTKTVMFGTQYYLKKFLSQPVTTENLDEAREVLGKHGVPFNEAGWAKLIVKHGGYLPLKIRAVPEGTVVPTKNILLSVENTDPEFFWLTSYVETLLLKIWYPITVATRSHCIKTIIKNFMGETADSYDGLEFKLHDFGYRGVSSEESAAIGGAANLLSMWGTDNLASVMFLRKYYDADMAGFSIPASEHSTITAWGKENEFQAFENMVDKYKGQPIFACVSDSYNIYEAIRMWSTLKHKLEKNGTMLVVRPDSGDPLTVSIECIKMLDKGFGSSLNTKGYKVLNNVRVIYGDGIKDETVIFNILKNLKEAGYSAENMAFGMGGGLLQKCNRDTQEFAMKCSAIVADGKTIEVYKEPIHSESNKVSKRGFLDLKKDVQGRFHTVPGTDVFASEMKTVFENGKLYNLTDLSKVRELLANN